MKHARERARELGRALFALGLYTLLGFRSALAVPVTFVYVPPSPQQSVFLAGTFNDWAASALAMQRGDDGVYRVTIDLAAGRHQYKFVLDNSAWREDPFAPNGYEDDGFGGKNSVVEVPEGLAAGVASFVVGKADGAAAPSPSPAPAPAAGSAGAVTGLRQVTFRYQPVIGGVTQMMLAGTFNDWNVGATPMQDADADGIFEATLMLAPGDYQYKYVVDGKWITDTAAEGFAPDGFGGQNSVIHVDDRYRAIDVSRGDGKFFLDDLKFPLDYSLVNPVSPTRLVFTARAHLNDVDGIDVVYWDVRGAERAVALEPVGEDPAFEYRRGAVELESPGRVPFALRYRDGDQSHFIGTHGPSPSMPADDARFVYAPETLPVFAVPDWVRDGVIYQIFPERFCNGDPSNDPDFSEPMYAGRTALPASGQTNDEYFHRVADWSDIAGLVRSPFRTDGRPDYYSFYGGDIEGVRQKLPYLRDLGITILYFNPLTQARSNHKYDPCDYNKIDPHFADEATFKRFVREAHASGIRIIVDMAYNHCGDCHFAFQDAWQKGRESPYYDWFEWKRWPPPAGARPGAASFKADDYYSCWWGFGIHPDLNFDLSRSQKDEHHVADRPQAGVNQPLVDHVLSSVDYWLGTLDVDGFRLDVPNEVPPWFWVLFAERVRHVKPDAYLVGELWGNASDWVGPDCFHAVMNYKFFREPVQKWLAEGNGSAAVFDRELSPGRWQYPQQSVEAQMNLIDSHDTIRLATLLKANRARQKLVALFAMTYVGAPHIFYGGEVGLEGGKDPDCRRPFPWDYEADGNRRELRDFYKRVIHLRHENIALRRGSFRTVLASQSLYGFLRESEGNRLLVLLNNSDTAATAAVSLADLGTQAATLRDVLNARTLKASAGMLQVPLAALGGAVIELPTRAVAGRK